MRQRKLALAVAMLSLAIGHSAWGGYYYVRDWGTLGGVWYYTYSQANGINANGEVAGVSSTSSGYGYDNAFLYSNGTMTSLVNAFQRFRYWDKPKQLCIRHQ